MDDGIAVVHLFAGKPVQDHPGSERLQKNTDVHGVDDYRVLDMYSRRVRTHARHHQR